MRLRPLPVHPVMTLARHYMADAARSRLFALLVLVWSASVLGGAVITSATARETAAAAAQEASARADYYDKIPNYRILFQNFFTQRRPSAPLAPLMAGVEYLAPTYIDYRPRFSPTFYYGDDIDPLMRFCVSPDLAATVGIVGLLVALLLCFDAVNGEIRSRNAHVLLCHGVSMPDIYMAKLVAHTLLLWTSFTPVFALSVGAFAMITGAPLAPLFGQLFGFLVVCLLYLAFAVALFGTISVFARRPAASFFAGVAAFVGIVYVAGFAAESVVNAALHDDYGPGDLVQDKVLYSRNIHRAYDQPVQRIWDKFRGYAWDDIPNIRERDAEFVEMLVRFSVENSEGTLDADRAYFTKLRRRNDATLYASMVVSPYVAFTRALSVLADTSIDADFAMTKTAGEDMFRKYRDAWSASAAAGFAWERTAPRKWILTPGRAPMHLGDFELEAPRQTWTERFGRLAPAVGVLVAFAALLVVAGRRKARRLVLL